MSSLPPYVPTEAEIREAAAEIRSGWSEVERLKRARMRPIITPCGRRKFVVPRRTPGIRVIRESDLGLS